MTDEQLATLLTIQKFGEWLDKETPDQVNQYKAEAVQAFGCKNESPMAESYVHFKAGMNAGIELANSLNNLTNKRNEKEQKKVEQEKELFTLHEVAEKLNISYQMARKLVLAGKLEAKKVGTVWRVRKADLENYINQ